MNQSIAHGIRGQQNFKRVLFVGGNVHNCYPERYCVYTFPSIAHVANSKLVDIIIVNIINIVSKIVIIIIGTIIGVKVIIKDFSC